MVINEKILHSKQQMYSCTCKLRRISVELHCIVKKCYFFFYYLCKCVILYYNTKLAHIYNVGADHGCRILTVYYSFEEV